MTSPDSMTPELAAVTHPAFLTLPERTVKPRRLGLTHVIDRGLGCHGIEDLLQTAGHAVDIVKLGWGTAYVTTNLRDKIQCYHRAGIPVCIGGTFFEACVAQNKVDAYCDWVEALGLQHIEISNGIIKLLAGEKRDWITKLSKRFTVISEVGSKNPDMVYTPDEWATWCERELAAGAEYIIAEGRESGTAGIFDAKGNLRVDIVEAIVQRVPVEKVIFEVPVRKHQTWFIQQFGSNVNLGNIAPSDVINVETLRLGLRADTFELVRK